MVDVRVRQQDIGNFGWVEGKCAVVQRFQRLRALKETAIDQ
jgi:hypothetical protein